MMPALNTLRFRSNPCIELKKLDDLAAEDRERFRELESDPEFYGIFVAKPPLVMNLKSVSHQAAELFQSLSIPGHLEVDDDVVDLVLDGILEIESGERFVSGADALAIVQPPLDARDIGRLSTDALLHAQDLETRDPQALSMALYLYNRIPMTPFWKTTFANVLEHVGADRGSLRALLEREWIAGDPARGTGWLNWSSPTRSPRGADDVTYKLYVSPRPERIRDAFEVVARVLAAFPGTSFKIGDGVTGLLRPDKLVAYFRTREQLDEVANELQRELAGCDAHGVPFTAPIGESGLLSWGVDPPESERALKWTGPRSWRLWVAQRLGAALAIALSASATGTSIEPWLFAVERVRRHGVDVETWTPSATLWSTS
jgi:hypothetical protein